MKTEELLTPWEQYLRWLGAPRTYRLTRSVLLRALGIVYLFAFLGLVHQVLPLLGSHGITPAIKYLDVLRAQGESARTVPTLFWIDCSDTTLLTFAWIGLVLSIVVVAGYSNAPVLAALWIIYGSFTRIGQLWFGFGWEIQLLETGFLAIFLSPPLDPRPSRAAPPPLAVIVLYRWLIFRIMLGSGLIKWHGDRCWRELTCLDYHFETQPVPNPLSPLFHRMPHWVHAGGLLFNHVVELVAPWFVFGPRIARLIAGGLMLAFQLTLIVSGNLSFLNWLTVVPIIACFDDDLLRYLVPVRARAWIDRRGAGAPARPHLAHTIAAAALAFTVGVLSLWVVDNLTAGKHQKMNHSFDRFDLVGTYGAFGSVTHERYELIIAGTDDETPGPATEWREYELPCKPGAVDRMPCFLGPYHHRLDWLMWFAAMDEDWREDQWVARVVWKLLQGDAGVRSLFSHDPFGGRPPRWIRVERYRYRFAGSGSDDWWVRDDPQPWLPPVRLSDDGGLTQSGT